MLFSLPAVQQSPRRMRSSRNRFAASPVDLGSTIWPNVRPGLPRPEVVSVRVSTHWAKYAARVDSAPIAAHAGPAGFVDERKSEGRHLALCFI